MLRLIVVFFALFAVSCGPTSYDTMPLNLDKMVAYGDLNTAMDILGIPDKVQPLDTEQSIYIWNNRVTRETMVSTQKNTTGHVGKVPYSQQTSERVPTYSEEYCEVKMIVDKQGKILRHSFKGGSFACYRFSNALENYFMQPINYRN